MATLNTIEFRQVGPKWECRITHDVGPLAGMMTAGQGRTRKDALQRAVQESYKPWADKYVSERAAAVAVRAAAELAYRLFQVWRNHR